MNRRVAIERFIAPAFPYHLVAAKRGDRIAWIENERRMRKVYTASGNSRPVRLTANAKDDGVDRDSARTRSPDGRRIASLRHPGRAFAHWAEVQDTDAVAASPDGFADARFAGGHALSIWIADAGSGMARERWQAPEGAGSRPSRPWTTSSTARLLGKGSN